jgi:acyl-coenzyme A synthetase/AMP-(fatty) acid ligase
MQIVDAILFWANATPAHPAIIQPHGVQSYRMLADAIMAAAAHFVRSELDPAKPVAVSIGDPARMLVACLGLLHAGFGVVPCSENLLQHLPLTGADTLMSEHGGLVWPDHATILFNVAWMSAHSRAAETRPSALPGRDGDIIFFTSGSTGKPKMNVHTPQARARRFLHSRTSTFADFQRVLVVPGLSSSFGFSRVSEILHGGKTVCLAPLGQPALLLANIRNIDFIIASVQQALALAELQEKNARFGLPSLKAIRLGGGKISPKGIERIKQSLCRNVIVAYAATETGTVAMAPYDMIAGIPDAVGFVIPEVKVEIVDAAGTPLPIGTEGLVRVQTPFTSVLSSSGAPDAGAESKWYYPGDIGQLTDNGVLCIAGRREDVLNRGGVKLATTDFEEFVLAAPGVRDAGACSVMGESGLAEIWIGVVLEDGVDVGDFQRHIESDQKFSSNIDKMFVVEEIPRGENRKLQREQLQVMLKSILEDDDGSLRVGSIGQAR